MKNEFVPYDIALAMKELDFREECFGFYDDILNNNETEHRLFPIRTQTLTDKMLETLTPAPLYQQAFNYLIERANSIHNDDYSIKIDQLYYTLCNGKTHITTGSSPNKCLRKLIEIVKER